MLAISMASLAEVALVMGCCCSSCPNDSTLLHTIMANNWPQCTLDDINMAVLKCIVQCYRVPKVFQGAVSH